MWWWYAEETVEARGISGGGGHRRGQRAARTAERWPRGVGVGGHVARVPPERVALLRPDALRHASTPPSARRGQTSIRPAPPGLYNADAAHCLLRRTMLAGGLKELSGTRELFCSRQGMHSYTGYKIHATPQRQGIVYLCGYPPPRTEVKSANATAGITRGS